ncbi:MAG: NADAR family protein [Gracilibacteraceae bacterium]|nr:NADAR family protein [Gracilibacteraceae bacterium]
MVKKFNSKKKLNYVFFWQPDKNYLSTNCFSQWQKSNFIVEGKHYNCAEQYMMGQKALIFNDLETFEKILSANHPKQMKSLGREVKNFDSNEWDNVKYSIVLNGNFYKFTQNEEMLKILLSTGDKILVEASPFDKIWGVGLSEDNKSINNPNYWKGQNVLGFALMEVRDEIKNI